STTGAPTPAAAARSVLACSWSRSMPSSPASLEEQRTTTSTFGPSSSVVTRRLWLVSPPGRSVARQDRPASVARRSRSLVSGSALERVDHGLVDRLHRAGEPPLGRQVPPEGQQQEDADDHD